jgi:Uma2 family endonuclease
MTTQLLNEIDVSELVIEDDTPVDNFQSAKQQRLLVNSLYDSWKPGFPFITDADIGLFYALKTDPIVPDVFLSLNLKSPDSWEEKADRSYFIWEFGKLPEVVIEIVSNKKGNELVAKDLQKPCKKDVYAQIRIPYYVVFDPLRQIQDPDQMNGEVLKVFVLQGRHYKDLQQTWLEDIDLGLTLWEGQFEDHVGTWLRWCDRAGKVYLTGAERAEKLAQKLRELGINPDEL